ncbi:MAG: triose-phosphate isomerase [Candidatus Stahlbacteria bacterium]|nr:triose-phosphate isomerase [Candidatus Stahlbacteria bacterium]
MKKYLIAGNWKMNKKIEEAKELATQIKDELQGVVSSPHSNKVNNVENPVRNPAAGGAAGGVEIAIFPPFTALYEVYKVIRGSNIGLGAQNMWYEKKGAYTGEIAPSFIMDAGCKYVIIGHSERRKYINESNELINRKIKIAITSELIPILCVGETLEEREKGKTEKVIEEEVKYGLEEITEMDMAKTVIAYEPVWAIGTGKTATPEMAEEIHKFIRNIIKNKYNQEVAENMRILYGGSVTQDNIEKLIAEPDIDGALVGGASIQADSFIQIVKRTVGRAS